MDWAYNGAQAGYNFMPYRTSYNAQVDTLAQWVRMAHMRPSVVDVPLPGAQPADAISVTTFDFISQFQSLLSDKELNVTNNRVINQHDGSLHALCSIAYISDNI
jgi:hypothetical protein